MANAAIIAKTSIIPSKAPNLPIGPVEYTQLYMDQFANTLRLYFNQIDNTQGALLGPNGGKFIRNPTLTAYNPSSQYALSNTASSIEWENIVVSSGFVIDTANNSAVCAQTGVYKVNYRIALSNNDSVPHDATIWLQLNFEDVDNSATTFTVPANGTTGAFSTYSFLVNAADAISLSWATDQAATANSSSLGVFLEATPALTSPYTAPAVPSAVGVITFISAPVT